MPGKGLVNIDVSEAAGQLFDNTVISKILQMYKHYYDQRVMMSPDDYYNKMVSNKLGRLDLDGICPYSGKCDDGSLRQPTNDQLMEWYDLKAAPTSWSNGERLFGGRPKNMMKYVVNTLEMYEKMMEFLVHAGYTPERMKFLTPMNKMKGTGERRNEKDD